MRRIATELLLTALTVAALLAASRGLAPVAPALRLLLHPVVLAGLAAALVLMRLIARSRPPRSMTPGDGMHGDA